MRIATISGTQGAEAAFAIQQRLIPVAQVNAAFNTRWSTSILELLVRTEFIPLRDWYGEMETHISTLEGYPSEIRHLPPYTRPPKILGVGLNYAAHAGDLGESPPIEPATFMKPATTIIGAGDKIIIPEQSKRTTGEAELGLIIGREGKNVTEDDAPSFVAGVTPIIDMTAEDILQRNPRFLTRAKSFDTFLSIGPEIVSLDEIDDINALVVATTINGRIHRSNVISNMTFSPWNLVAFFSSIMKLEPGDVISTGTPGAVVLSDGDVVGCSIPGIGELTNPVSS